MIQTVTDKHTFAYGEGHIRLLWMEIQSRTTILLRILGVPCNGCLIQANYLKHINHPRNTEMTKSDTVPA